MPHNFLSIILLRFVTVRGVVWQAGCPHADQVAAGLSLPFDVFPDVFDAYCVLLANLAQNVDVPHNAGFAWMARCMERLQHAFQGA